MKSKGTGIHLSYFCARGDVSKGTGIHLRYLRGRDDDLRVRVYMYATSAWGKSILFANFSRKIDETNTYENNHPRKNREVLKKYSRTFDEQFAKISRKTHETLTYI